MPKPEYLIDCPTCLAPALLPCRTLKTKRVTDTHYSRVDRQFENPDRATVIRRVLHGIYGKSAALYMSSRINEKWEEWSDPDNRDELMLYIWMNQSGGGTAEIAAERIRLQVSRWEHRAYI